MNGRKRLAEFFVETLNRPLGSDKSQRRPYFSGIDSDWRLAKVGGSPKSQASSNASQRVPPAALAWIRILYHSSLALVNLRMTGSYLVGSRSGRTRLKTGFNQPYGERT